MSLVRHENVTRDKNMTCKDTAHLHPCFQVLCGKFPFCTGWNLRCVRKHFSAKACPGSRCEKVSQAGSTCDGEACTQKNLRSCWVRTDVSRQLTTKTSWPTICRSIPLLPPIKKKSSRRCTAPVVSHVAWHTSSGYAEPLKNQL